MTNHKKIIIETTSSSAKIYALNNSKKFINQMPLDTSPEKLRAQLYKIISLIQKKYFGIPINIYASNLHSQMDQKSWKDLVNELYLTTGVIFCVTE